MALLRNSNLIALACFVTLATPAAAQNYDELSRSDFISLSGGDAARANIAIQTPTPWPSYVNDVNIPGDGTHAVLVLEELAKRHSAEASPSTVINIGMPPKP